MRAILAKTKSLLQSLWSDRRGTVFVFIGAAVIPVVASMGIALDSARGYLVKSRLSQALDAAGLAGGRVFDSANRDNDIRMFFNANFLSSQYSATVDGPHITANAASGTLTITATATFPTTFMRVVGINTLSVQATTTITRLNREMELVLVMDNTGSMQWDNKMPSMQTAALNLLSILYGTRDTIDRFNVGVVPFITMVRPGNQYTAWSPAPTNYAPTISSLTRPVNANDPGRVVVLTQVAHQFRTGDIVTIAGATGTNASVYNGPKYIYVETDQSVANWDRTFYYRVPTSSSPTRTPGGTITATRAMTYPTSSGWSGYPTGGWAGCVRARNPPYEEEQAEEVPSNQPFPRYFWQSTYNSATSTTMTFADRWGNTVSTSNWPFRQNDWRQGSLSETSNRSPNAGCRLPAVLPLQPSRAAAEAVINQMAPVSFGGTHFNLGMAWGWRVLSPRWRGLWGSPSTASLPGDYQADLRDKVVVILTDGQNEWINEWADYGRLYNTGQYYTDYSGYTHLEAGLLNGITDVNAAITEMNDRFTRLCTAMRSQNIIIYTILLGTSAPATAPVFQACASSPENYFFAPSASDLNGIFTQIGNQLRRLRISR